MYRAKQGRKRFIVETDNNTGRWQIGRIRLLPTSANRNIVVITIFSGISIGLGHY